jgi:LuxR family maltose regulon positive regulatory protein
VELAGDADEVLVAALAAQARALYLAGELDGAWVAALRAVEHPEAERRAPGLAFARSTLALVAVERAHLSYARHHAEAAGTFAPGVGRSRSWIGANASLALGSVLAAEGDLVTAERELARAERFFRDEVASVHHAWLLVLLADVQRRRGRLDRAAEALAAARAELEAIADPGRVAELASRAERELAGAREQADGRVAEPPSEAELAVLRLLTTDLSTRGVAAQLFLSPNTVRSHTRALYRKLGVSSRSEAVARATTLGLVDGGANHPGDLAEERSRAS